MCSPTAHGFGMTNEIEIIAEIGVNHNGNAATAMEMIYTAKTIGVDTVKFQCFHGDRYPDLQFAASEWFRLRDAARSFGLRFLVTPDDWDDVQFLVHGLEVDRIKIGSSNVTNLPLLGKIGQLDIPIILSLGASTAVELADAQRALGPPFGVIPQSFTVMHCVSAYPAPTDQLNLSVILELVDGGFDVGFSDHTLANARASLVALGLGARVFEKHFTLRIDQPGPDHEMSLDPAQMRAYVRDLRDGAAMLGDGYKRIMPCEMENRKEYERFVAKQRVTVDAYSSPV